MTTMPKDEFKKRITRVIDLAHEKAVEAIFIYFNELFIYNARYLTDWHPTVEQGAVLISESGKYCVLCGPEAGPSSNFDSMIGQARYLPCFMVPEEEYPGAYISSFQEIFSEFVGKSKVKRLGIVGIDATPYGVIKSLKKDLQEVEFVDLTSEYERLRAIKSDWEIDNIKTAYKITDEATKAMIPLIKSGIREYEVAAEGEYIARKMGANGFSYQTIIGTGERMKGIVPVASNHKYKSGEITSVAISPRFNGYCGTAVNTYMVDNRLTKDFKEYMNIVAEALFLTKSNIKIGDIGKDIDRTTRNFIKSKGLAEYSIMPYLHSSGLCEYEIPFFGPNSNDMVQENMVLCIDLSLFNHPKFPGVRIETGWIVRKDGPESLSPFMESGFRY